ncbi:Alpha-glucan water dikinase [Durusdinium trenchii]|uniref:Chloroplastic (Starch-related protein R1) n=1 Tax=Durusdinium trenchii TaxID=1381693 RepID=A0ABP0NMR6_9DINO
MRWKPLDRAELWKSTASCRLWIRWTLSTMGRGGSAGQQIRDEILVIMHAHDIKEIHGTYYEQWNQKLHNNTTPADIGICRAIIAYLRSGGDMGTYWKVLGEHGITKDHLSSYSRPITTEPYMVQTDVGRLIGDFEPYLGILRNVHDALDLQLALDHAKGCLPGHVQGKLQDICNMGGTGFGSLDEGHGKFMKISSARDDLLAILNNKGTEPAVIKQLLVIDYTLETQQSVLVQGLTAETRLPQLCEQLRALLTALVGHLPQEDELQALLADWTTFSESCSHKRWNSPEESALLLKALCDRTSRVVGELSDKCQTLMGPKAAFLGAAIDAPRKNIDVFVDEVLRGTSLMAVSLILQRMEPVLRDIAHLPPWQMISPIDKPIKGVLQLIDKMTGVQGEVFHTPTILLSGAVSGEEEVPDGVLGVLVRSAKEAPDILSHCAVRARNFGVLLCTCFDPKISEKLAADFANKWIEVRCKADGSLVVAACEKPATLEATQAAAEAEQAKAAQAEVKMNLTDDLSCSWCVRPDEMNRTSVGSKSLNLALLRPKLPAEIFTPQAVALPYGTMQKSLTDDANKQVLPMLQKVLNRLQPHTSNEDAQVIFEEAQQIIESMKFPKALKEAMHKAMGEVGAKDGEERLTKLFHERDAWTAVKGVWSSLFALRPWVSLAKAGRSFHDLNMAVLVQELVEAKYAFVLHTINPFTKDKDELYGELVAGRGETLVGNFPGRALSFAVRKGGEPRVISFPSKSVALHTQHCLIFRSDSNGEDLEGFAGAGLFESVCAEEEM